MYNNNYILHIFPKEKFTNGYTRFINENYEKKNHLFIIYGENHSIKLQNDSNILYYPQFNIYTYYKLYQYMRNAKKVIFHSLFINPRALIFVMLNKKIMNKVNIVFWGADIHSFISKPANIKQIVRDNIRKRVIKNAKYIITLVKGDYEILKKYVPLKGKYFEGRYMDDEEGRKVLFHIVNQKNDFKGKNNINILIGNSATSSNNHLDAFKYIEKYKNYDIKIYVPLSYGDKKYANNIIKEGKKIFGDKFIPLTDFMPIQKYYELLSAMDVAIFNNNRQQALGNINALLFLGCKVFIRKDTPMWDYFVNQKQVNIYDIDIITYLDFKNFSSLGRDEKENNYRSISKIYDKKECIEIWNRIFG